jgi:hypothetical protein
VRLKPLGHLSRDEHIVINLAETCIPRTLVEDEVAQNFRRKRPAEKAIGREKVRRMD